MRLFYLALLVLCCQLCADQDMIVRPVHVSFPTPNRAQLRDGYVYRGYRDNQHAFRITVSTDDSETGPWRVFIRAAEDYFEPEGFRSGRLNDALETSA